MKKIIFLTLAFLSIVFGCSKEPIDEGNGTLKNTLATSSVSNVITPMRIWISSTPDLTIPTLKNVPESMKKVIQSGGGWMDGHSNFFKNADPTQSHFVFTNCSYDAGNTQLILSYAGKIVTDRGDSFYYTGYISVDAVEYSFFGELNLDGGTGRFKEISGVLGIEGAIDAKTGEYTWAGQEITVNPTK